MKSTSNIELPKPQPKVLKSISLELTPREAFLLMMLTGNLTGQEAHKFLNRNDYINETCTPVPQSVKGKIPLDGANSFIYCLYDSIKVELGKAHDQNLTIG